MRPLVSQFQLDGKVQRVEYENLHVICFHCGKYMHNKEGCPDRDDNGPYEENQEANMEQNIQISELLILALPCH